MYKRNKKAVVVFSGGQDSTTCLGWAYRHFEEVHAVSLLYGQRHNVELECAKKILSDSKTPHKLIDISFLGSLVDSALTKNLLDNNVTNNHPRIKEVPATYVPNRNTMLLTIAHAYAQSIGADHMVTGITTTDFWKWKPITKEWLLGFLYGANVTTSLKKAFQKSPDVTNAIIGDDICLLYNLANEISKYLPDQKKHDFTITQMALDSYALSYGRFSLENDFIFSDTNYQFVDKMIDQYFLDDQQTISFGTISDITNDKINEKHVDFIVGYIESNYRNDLSRDIDNIEIPTSTTGIDYVIEKFYKIIYDKTRTITMRAKLDNVYFKDTDMNVWGAAYPDCTPQFRYQLEKTLTIGSKTPIKIHAPLQYLNKSLIFGMAEYYDMLDTVIHESHTCYNGNHVDKHEWGYGCGECPSCKLRLNGYYEYTNIRKALGSCIYNPNIFE